MRSKPRPTDLCGRRAAPRCHRALERFARKAAIRTLPESDGIRTLVGVVGASAHDPEPTPLSLLSTSGAGLTQHPKLDEITRKPVLCFDSTREGRSAWRLSVSRPS
jgi:hypothetical protein